jgi:hypothetical protein
MLPFEAEPLTNRKSNKGGSLREVQDDIHSSVSPFLHTKRISGIRKSGLYTVIGDAFMLPDLLSWMKVLTGSDQRTSLLVSGKGVTYSAVQINWGKAHFKHDLYTTVFYKPSRYKSDVQVHMSFYSQENCKLKL